jgi:predicted CXXCH cytochrome family protein
LARIAAVSAPLVAVLVALLANSCSTTPRTVLAPLDIPGASYVGNQVCFECHSNYVRRFSASPHARLHAPDARLAGQGGCESCHGPGSLHAAAGGGRGKAIINPRSNPAACFACHLATQAEFRLPYHHAVTEGRMNCVQCHDPHGMNALKPAGGLAMARRNESCAQCHREQTRPFAFEHEAMREGCTACHIPHGSVNNKLLRARDSNLCLRCHAQSPGPAATPGRLYIGATDHTTFVRMGACYSAGCHTAIHGSNLDHRLRY